MNLPPRYLFALALTCFAAPTGALASQPCPPFESSERATLVLREVSIDDEVVEPSEDYQLETSTYAVELRLDRLDLLRATDETTYTLALEPNAELE